MKKSDILLDHSYVNHRGQVRKIIAEGPDKVRYEVLARPRGCPVQVGDRGNMTRASFAAWAHQEVA